MAAAAAAAAAELPEEVITNILVRLPVNTLLKFRCVCKSWRSLISEPYFIRRHVSHVNLENECQTTIFLLNENRVKSVDFIQNEGNNKILEPSIKDVDFPDEFNGAPMRIRCCCNGIICLSDIYDKRLLLWNPSIRKYRALLLLPLTIFQRLRRLVLYGIGYDPSIDDYKIFRVHSFVDVFALKSNSWRRIESTFPYKNSQSHKHATFTNGRIHWIATLGETEEEVIAYIDVVTETFGHVPLPLRDKCMDNYRHFLQLYKGNLCVVQSRNSQHGESFLDRYGESYPYHLWVMKKYGVKESWMRLFTVPARHNGLRRGYESIIPLSLSRTGMLLSSNNRSAFVRYCPRPKFFELLIYTPFNSYDCIPYVESLVSP